LPERNTNPFCNVILMSDETAKWETQLPKKQFISFASFFSYLSGIASIFGLLLTGSFVSQQQVYFVHTIFLLILILSLCAHTYLRDKRKLHRYAQAILYIHYVNHIIRDQVACLTDRDRSGFDLKTTSRDIVNATANCFSLLTSKKCRCSIVELQEDLQMVTTTRDNITENKRERGKYRDRSIKLENCTEFRNLWYSLNGCTRYYLCNDLLSEWKNRKYEHASFIDETPPRFVSFLSIFSFTKDWSLPYRSILVLPIRYVKKFDPPKQQQGDDVKSNGRKNPELSHWNFWGFLCIDCNSRNIFDREFAPELAAAFADCLYILFDQSNYALENNKEKISQSKVETTTT
jgi:hypothetical protein